MARTVRGILYQYRNQADKTEIVSGPPSAIAQNISDDLDTRRENLLRGYGRSG